MTEYTKYTARSPKDGVRRVALVLGFAFALVLMLAAYFLIVADFFRTVR